MKKRLVINNELYLNDLSEIANKDLPWEYLNNKSVLITGATGLICSFLVDTIMYRNKHFNNNITIYVIGRNTEKAIGRFGDYFNSTYFKFIKQDISEPLELDKSVNIIIHGASNSHPKLFAEDPVGTMNTNYIGMNNLLNFSVLKNTEQIIYISSSEVYGESNNDKIINEQYLGYIDLLNPRSCYPSSKRATETLCASYAKQFNLNIKIIRPSHIYGPTMTDSDSRVSSQFIRDALEQKNIILKSEGKQIRSYCYVSDCASGIFTILFKGKKSEAYNLSNNNSVINIFRLASIISSLSGVSIEFDLPTKQERQDFNPVNKIILDSSKLESLDWKPVIKIEDGIKRILNILKQ